MEATRPESSLQWVTARLPGDVVREIEAHAKRMGATRSDAIRDCLGLGIEAIRGRDGIPAGRADELLSALEGVRLTLRDAVDKTFRGPLRGAQGVFAVHQHGGTGRPAHPHVHALLSPRFANRMAVHISPQRIHRLKERWEREVLAGLQRHERRLDRMRLEFTPRLPTRPVDRGQGAS
jgi:ribbon-helix-helix CopG family protein